MTTITVPRATWDAMREANVQWIEAYAKLRLEKDSLRIDAELGRIAMRFVDRAGDVADCDPAERICSEFYEAMSDAVDRLCVQPREAFDSADDMQHQERLQDFQNGYDTGYEAGVLHASQATEPAEKRKLYECTGCGHLYEERPSSCECMENPANTYNDWIAKPAAPEAKQ